MVPSLQAPDITLGDLREQFGLTQADAADFFPEGRALQHLKQNYFNLTQSHPLLEEAVKMVVLSPLLDLAGFYSAPFSIRTEASVELVAVDESTTVRGSIDVLVVARRLWVLVVEAKSTRFDVLEALPQALAYMLSAPSGEPIYGLLLNGREFVFVKLALGGDKGVTRQKG